MRRIFLILLLCTPLALQADVLDDILTGKYNAQTLSAEYMDSVLNSGRQTDRYILKHENEEKIFRRSFVADYYLWDTKKQVKIPVSDTKVRDAQMSPNGKYIVYAKGHSLYIYKVDFATEVAIVAETDSNRYNGVSDWLYEEEFGVTCLFCFSPDSRQVAFVRLDASSVPEMQWQTYGNGLDMLYPASCSLRYSKSGCPNPKAVVCVYDIHDKTIKTMQIRDNEDRYIPRICWTNLPALPKNAPSTAERPSASLVIETVNRDQTAMEVLLANPKSTVCRPLYTEKSDRYFMDYSLFDEWVWLSDNRFVVLSEKNGWRQLYLHNSDGSEVRQLTHDGMDVTKVYGVNEGAKTICYQAAPTALTRQAYVLNWKNNTVTPLTEGDGIHTLTFAEDKKQYIDCFESNTTPNTYTLYAWDNGKSKRLRVLEDNRAVSEAWRASNLPNKRFLRIPTERGDTLDAWMILPEGAETSGRRYPVVLMQYSGPASQQVKDAWRKRFGHYLAHEGYVVVNADPRGTDCRGRVWRNQTYMNLGKKEAEDHLSVARYMQSLPYVDGNRIAMIGWSYGGYQTARTMSEQGKPAIIRCGVAIAPVTDWRLYDTGYTERYMRRPQVNEDGYLAASLLEKAAQLEGKLLIVHGLADDNVHAQNTLLYTDALVQAGKQFEMQLYIDDNHFLKQRAHYRHVHERILSFFKQNL